MRLVSGICIILLFFGALFWAKDQDPFSRTWFTLKTADGNRLPCVAVLPKPMRHYPVIIYAHGSGGSLMTDGTDLRQMAELGLAAVSLEYDQTNAAAFPLQFESLLTYLSAQRWVDTNAIAWVGFSLGANRTWDYALHHPAHPPQLLVQLSGSGLNPATGSQQLVTNPHCPVLLVHSEQDEIFPVNDAEQLAALLQTNGLPVALKILPGLPHGLEPDREVIFRGIGEYCLTHLTGRATPSPAFVWEHYHSIAQWQVEAPPFWLFCLPAILWLAGSLAWRHYRRPAPAEKVKLTYGEVALRWLAVILALCALTETTLHLAPPHFAVSNRTLSLARKYLVQPKERADFEYLAARPIWHNQKLKTLLEHVQLASYNRELINWTLDDKIYRKYVLSPQIELLTEPSTFNPQLSTSLDWRRPLWEEFYPRIRHESSPADAVPIVIRHLRERVTITDIPNPPREVSTIWLRQITDAAGFQTISVAALRSVGVAARLNANGHAEFWNNDHWSPTPDPAIVSW